MNRLVMRLFFLFKMLVFIIICVHSTLRSRQTKTLCQKRNDCRLMSEKKMTKTKDSNRNRIRIDIENLKIIQTIK